MFQLVVLVLVLVLVVGLVERGGLALALGRGLGEACALAQDGQAHLLLSHLHAVLLGLLIDLGLRHILLHALPIIKVPHMPAFVREDPQTAAPHGENWLGRVRAGMVLVCSPKLFSFWTPAPCPTDVCR